LVAAHAIADRRSDHDHHARNRATDADDRATDADDRATDADDRGTDDYDNDDNHDNDDDHDTSMTGMGGIAVSGPGRWRLRHRVVLQDRVPVHRDARPIR
jgi:hypothetical protein